ncbi:Peptidase family M1 [Amycolatopsis xylanica]|uniref:Aminopeptidase N n=1 Tax=Amycolatopsis xylanica TaxID=589385 RepID=A0A1H3J064_9PSEU|nr:M1 family metallopeptidase [Amycolatopsis xylanica]SDY32949.1 Peptidase family M1 [Amycolatopsis xylanica]
MRSTRRVTTLFAAVLLCANVGAAAASPDGLPRPGSDGAGDSYFPLSGNGGYDVAEYDLDIGYVPSSKELTGQAKISAKATQSLSSFNLDLHKLTVDAVKVNGVPAKFSRTGDELTVTPRLPLWKGLPFTAEITYHGVPEALENPRSGPGGWRFSESGGAFVQGEPLSASTWFPANDTPRDKAAFQLAVTVPSEWTVVASGRETGTRTSPRGTTYLWSQRTPAAPYLVTVAIDKWKIVRGKIGDGVPTVHAFQPDSDDAENQRIVDDLPSIIGFFSEQFGPYPVDSAGGIFLRGSESNHSLETIGRPIYSSGGRETIIHETAHQWFGDAVSVGGWKDICLNECLATYAQWIFPSGDPDSNIDRYYDFKLGQYDRFIGWDDPADKLYDMGRENLFRAVYDKGPLAIHALRRTVGDDTFFQLLKTWVAEHRDGTATTQDFQRLAERLSHKNLQPFFDAWFYHVGRPAEEFLHPKA